MVQGESFNIQRFGHQQTKPGCDPHHSLECHLSPSPLVKDATLWIQDRSGMENDMATQAIQQIADDRSQLRSFKKLLVAHDFSPAADRALTDAMAISGQFQAEIVVAHVEDPNNQIYSDINTPKQARAAIEDIRNHVALADHP